MAEAEGRLPKASPGELGEARSPKASPEVGDARGAALPGTQWSAGERSEPKRNEAPGNADRGGNAQALDPEVPDRPRRRRFTAEYKRRVLRQLDACSRGEVAALLRREGLYSSHISAWRRELASLETAALSPKKRGPKSTKDPVLAAEVQRLRRQNASLQRQLKRAEVCLEIQKKASELLGIPLNTPADDENE